MNTHLTHPLDLSNTGDELSLELFAEELPPQQHRLGDCASTAGTISTTGTGCVGTFFCFGSITSCGS